MLSTKFPDLVDVTLAVVANIRLPNIVFAFTKPECQRFLAVPVKHQVLRFPIERQSAAPFAEHLDHASLADDRGADTSVPARVFGLKDPGRIRSGMRADLVLVEGDPTRDIRATRKIAAVWKRGIRVDR